MGCEMVTKVGQLNLHKARAASHLLAKKFISENFDIMLLQEPWVNRGKICGLSTQKAELVYDVREERPRACILIDRKLSYTTITEFLSMDLVAVEVRSEIKPEFSVVLASAYFPGEDREAPPRGVQKLVEYCKEKKKELIVSCDANAHNEVWGSTDNNKRGESLLEYLLVEGLIIHNQGIEPTFINRIREEVLDITFSTIRASRLLHNWQVAKEDMLSDHRMITFEIGKLAEVNTVGRNPRRTNWENFRQKLEFSVLLGKEKITCTEELDREVAELNQVMLSAYEDSCPPRPLHRNNEAPWWNQKLEKGRKQVRKLFNRAKRTGNWTEYETQRREYSKAIREAKRADYRKFCEEIQETPEAARLYRAYSKDKGIRNLALKRADGKYTETEEEKAILLLQAHFPGSKPASTCEEPTMHKSQRATHKDWAKAKHIVTEQTTRMAVASFDRYKAPGIDGIIPAFLQEGIDIIIPKLIAIFRASISLGYIPKPWRKAKVVFIPKPGKKDQTNVKSYRPISLTSCLLKTLEKILDFHIRTEILNTSPLQITQHAYMAGKSTETAVYQLVSSIKNSLENKEIALCVFLDIEGAFDNTPHSAIKRALDIRGTHPTINAWVQQMLITRQAETTVGNTTIEIQTTKGCPQGGVLSPLLWSLVVDELLLKLANDNIWVQGYADDIVIMVKGIDAGTICDLMQSALKKTYEWCREVELRINPEKTIAVPFTRKKKYTLKTLRYEGKEITIEKEATYLGIILDKELRWHKHQQKVMNKAKKAVMICSRLGSGRWGCQSKIMLWMYNAIVKPIITYGAIVWSERMKFATARHQLGSIQRLACLTITGAMRSCPTAGMEALLDLIPIDLVLQQKAEETKLRILVQTKYTGIKLTHRHMAEIRQANKLVDMPTDHMPVMRSIKNNFNVQLNNKKNFKAEADYMIKPQTLKWYTDGSKTSEGTGAGVSSLDTNISIPMGKYPSIFQAEVKAIDCCIQTNLERQFKNKEIAILSDSQAALRAISSTKINSRLVWECVEKLNRLSRQNKVNLYWIPGHAGIEGNEHADELAKQGASTPMPGPEPYCGLSYQELKRQIRSKYIEKATKEWKKNPGMRQSKILIGGYNGKRAKELLTLKRSEVRAITGLLTGHCKLGGHLLKIGIGQEGECRFCKQAEETPQHILQECMTIVRFRWKHLKAIKPKTDILRSISVGQIIRFLRDIGLSQEL